MYRSAPRREREGVAEDGSFASWSVSGDPGGRAADGARGRDGRTSGESGGRGADAGPAQVGESAGRIELLLEAHPYEGDRVVLRTTTVDPEGGRVEETDDPRFGEYGFVDLHARGGRGGDGGRGGRGGDGARGYAGRDATKYRSGGDGGPGGAGGRGGRGSNGASGGAGGTIRILCKDADTHLLMLVRTEVAGGEGGRAGAHGSGGSGGPGGPGGRSKSWSESYTDSNGNRRTRTKRRAGGSRGPRGPDGVAGSGPLYHGADGPPGEVVWVVESATYPDRYRLALEHFEHQSLNADGVYEPGERVRVEAIQVRNVGGMPTPAHHDVHLALELGDWIFPDDAHLLLPRSLGPGGVASVPGELLLTLTDFTPEGPADPLDVRDVIRHRATLPAVQRGFAGYHGPEDDALGAIRVRFPVGASPVEALHALAPGEVGRVRWSVENVSTKSLGRRHGRVVRMRLGLHESELAADRCLVFDDEARPRGDEWTFEVDALEAGETLDFEGAFGVRRDAPHYEAAQLWMTLELGALKEPLQPRAIQHRQLEVRVARRFAPPPNADVLLVVHAGTERASLDAWTEAAQAAGREVAVWDVSLEGHLDLERPVEGASLGERFGTIVLLEDRYPSAGGPTTPWARLPLAGARRYVRGDGRLVLSGEAAGEAALDGILFGDEAPQTEHASRAAFHESLGEEAHAAIAQRRLGFWWEKPTAHHLKKRAWQLADELKAAHPERRFAVVHEPAIEVDESWGILKRWSMGRLRVVEGLPASGGHVLRGSDRQGTMRLAEPFAAKLRRLATLVSQGEEDEALADAIVVDLVREQQAATRGGRTVRLPRLDALVTALGDVVDPSTQNATLLRILARLETYARAQLRWWEWALVGIRPKRIALSAIVEARDALVGDERKDALREAREALRDALRSQKRETILPMRLLAEEEMLAPEAELDQDAAWEPTSGWILTREQLEAHERHLAERGVAIRRQDERGAEARSDLLRSERCGALERAGVAEVPTDAGHDGAEASS